MQLVAALCAWPPVFEDSGEGWSVRISVHPRAADERGPGQFTVGIRSAGKAHIETAEGLEQSRLLRICLRYTARHRRPPWWYQVSQRLAEQRFAVITTDGRGTPGRDPA